MRSFRLGLVASCLLVWVGICEAVPGTKHVYFSARPEVLDLSNASGRDQELRGISIPVGQLSPDVAQIIRSTATRAADAPEMVVWREEYIDTDSRKTRAREMSRIAKEAPAVRRDGESLLVATGRGAAVRFENWSKHASAHADDAGGETFVYAGRLEGSGYQRVEVQYVDDAPGAALVNPVNGKGAYVWIGNDTVALAPGGKRILEFDALNWPGSLAIASLDADGPMLEVRCTASRSLRTGEGLSVAFKGWRDPNSLDFDLSFTPNQGAPVESIPLRLEFDGHAWHANAAMPERLEKGAGLSCLQIAGSR